MPHREFLTDVLMAMGLRLLGLPPAGGTFPHGTPHW